MFLCRPTDGTLPQPYGKTGRLENQYQKIPKRTKDEKTPKALEGTKMPPRPGYGTKGNETVLWANYFQLIANGSQRLFRYNLDITLVKKKDGQSPKKEEAARQDNNRQLSGRKARRIVELFLDEHFAQHKDHIATDYRSTLVSRGQLEFQEDGYVVKYRYEDEKVASDKTDVYECVLKPTGAFSISELTSSLESNEAGQLYGSKDEVISCINIVMGQYCKAHPDIASIGANKHYEVSGARVESMDLGAGLKAVRGFFVSARAATARVLLNIQVKNAAFYQEGPLHQLIMVYGTAAGMNPYKLDKFLGRLRVKVTHLKDKGQGKAGVVKERVKTLAGVATTRDGQGLEHPPKVPNIAAGSNKVEFWYVPDKNGKLGGGTPKPSPAKGKGKGKGKPEGPPEAPQYITVEEYFKRGEFYPL